LLPLARGILSTIYVTLAEPQAAADIEALYRKFYAGRPWSASGLPAPCRSCSTSRTRIFATSDSRSTNLDAAWSSSPASTILEKALPASRAEFQPYAGNRGANLTSMRIVIKFAGALLEDDDTVRALAQQVAALAQEGHEILIVHGGGRLFTATLKRMAIESKFIAGLRVTDRETRDVAVMVFAGLLNKKLTAAISAEGQPAVGVSAADARCFVAEPMVHNEVEGSLASSAISPD